MNTIRQLFVYGSLRKGFGHAAFKYISDYFHFVSEGRVRGKVYDLGEYPAAVPCSEEHFIVGELYAIKQDDAFSYAIAQLDDYEGVNPGDDGSSLYRREPAPVYTSEGVTEAWVYWYNGSLDGYPEIVLGDVMEYKQQGVQTG